MKTTHRHTLPLLAAVAFAFGCGGMINPGTGTQSQTSTQSPSCVTPPANIVAWWPAEGNATDIIGGNVGALQSVTFGPGEVGQAFSFSGSQAAEVAVAAPNFETPNTGFTVEGWVNLSSLGFCFANQCSTVAHRETSGASRTWWLGVDDASIRFLLFLQKPSAGRVDVSSPSVVTAGSFQHIAASYDGNNIKLYHNGTLATTQAVGAANFNTGDPINIGMENLTTAGTFDLFKGEIDELSIYNRALTDQEIAAIFGAGTAGKCHPGAPGVDGGNPPGGSHHDDDGEDDDDEAGDHQGNDSRDHHGWWREREPD